MQYTRRCPWPPNAFSRHHQPDVFPSLLWLLSFHYQTAENHITWYWLIIGGGAFLVPTLSLSVTCLQQLQGHNSKIRLAVYHLFLSSVPVLLPLISSFQATYFFILILWLIQYVKALKHTGLTETSLYWMPPGIKWLFQLIAGVFLEWLPKIKAWAFSPKV